MAILLVVAASFLMAQMLPTKVVEANEFVLKDASGKVRARLWFGLKPTATPESTALDFYDATGKELLVALDANAARGSASLRLGGLLTYPNLYLGTDKTQVSATLQPSAKIQGIQLSAKPGDSCLSLNGTEGVLKGTYLRDTNAGSELSISDAQSDAHVFLGTKAMRSTLILLGKQGEDATLWPDAFALGGSPNRSPIIISAQKDGPYISLRDNFGFEAQLGVSQTTNTQTGQSLTSSAASLKMFDKEGKAIWSAP